MAMRMEEAMLAASKQTVPKVKIAPVETEPMKGDGDEVVPLLSSLTEVLSEPSLSSSSSTPKSCLGFNSKSWLEGTRLGNTRDGNITHDMAMDMILNTPSLIDHGPFVSSQTICHKQSRFLNWTDDGSDGDKSLKYWALRLAYLSYWSLQHKDAQKEAELRRDNDCEKELEDHGVGVFDYECPDAKFLVVAMGEMGLGAVMRLGAVNALMAGMATNRTVVFVNNIGQHRKVSSKSLWKPWVHASCQRGDIQCFFMPPTPCTVTLEEIENAKVLSRSEGRMVFKFGQLPEGHENERVYVCNFILRPQHLPTTFRPNLLALSNTIVERFREAHPNDERGAVMARATDLLLETEEMEEDRPYYYFGAVSKVHHAAVFYSMRPNPHYSAKIDHILDQIVPQNYNPDISFGLPIRGE